MDENIYKRKFWNWTEFTDYQFWFMWVQFEILKHRLGSIDNLYVGSVHRFWSIGSVQGLKTTLQVLIIIIIVIIE